MNKALKGILATYGIEETINTLLWYAMDGFRSHIRLEDDGVRGCLDNINRDLDFLAYLMECHSIPDQDTGALAKIQDIGQWRLETDQKQFEDAGKSLQVERLEWVEQ